MTTAQTKASKQKWVADHKNTVRNYHAKLTSMQILGKTSIRNYANKETLDTYTKQIDEIKIVLATLFCELTEKENEL